MPALSAPAREPRDRHLRLIGVAFVALFMASLAVAWGSPTEARDWTPQIKAARGSQIYWESVMRAADRDVGHARKAQKRARTALKRSKARYHLAVQRRARAKGSLELARSALRTTRMQRKKAQAARAAEAAVPGVTTALALRLAGFDGVGVGPVSPLGPVTIPDLLTQTQVTGSSIPSISDRESRLLEKRARKQRRSLQRTRRKEQRAWQAVSTARARLASTKAAERAAIARRESAERNLGSWIVAMERYAHGRAGNMSKFRPGIDSPFAWPAHGRISQYYSRSHDGLDIVSYSGAPIRAAAFGVVAYVGWNPWDEHGRAFMVVVAHAGGLETLYGHMLPRRSVRVGQAVKKGTVIGYMGNTGNSSGTHLHFEVRRGHTTVNPLGYL